MPFYAVELGLLGRTKEAIPLFDYFMLLIIISDILGTVLADLWIILKEVLDPKHFIEAFENHEGYFNGQANFFKAMTIIFLVSLANYSLEKYMNMPHFFQDFLSIPDRLLINLIESIIIYVTYA